MENMTTRRCFTCWRRVYWRVLTILNPQKSPNFQHLLCNLAFKIKEASGLKIPDSVFFFKEGFEMDAGIVKMRDMFKAIGYMDCACCLLKAEWEEGLSREEIIRRVATDEGRYFLLLPLAQRYQTVLKEEKRKEQEGNMKRCVQYTLHILYYSSASLRYSAASLLM